MEHGSITFILLSARSRFRAFVSKLAVHLQTLFDMTQGAPHRRRDRSHGLVLDVVCDPLRSELAKSCGVAVDLVSSTTAKLAVARTSIVSGDRPPTKIRIARLDFKPTRYDLPQISRDAARKCPKNIERYSAWILEVRRTSARS